MRLSRRRPCEPPPRRATPAGQSRPDPPPALPSPRHACLARLGTVSARLQRIAAALIAAAARQHSQCYLCLAGTGARRAVAVTRSCADPRAACARRRVRASLALASSPTLDRQAALPRQETRPPGRGAAITAAITAPAEFSPQHGGTTRARLRPGSRVVPFATAITVTCGVRLLFLCTHVSVIA